MILHGKTQKTQKLNFVRRLLGSGNFEQDLRYLFNVNTNLNTNLNQKNIDLDIWHFFSLHQPGDEHQATAYSLACTLNNLCSVAQNAIINYERIYSSMHNYN